MRLDSFVLVSLDQHDPEVTLATFVKVFGDVVFVPCGSTIPQYASLTTLWITVLPVPVQLKLIPAPPWKVR